MIDLRSIRRDKRSPFEDFMHRVRWGAVVALLIFVLPIIVR